MTLQGVETPIGMRSLDRLADALQWMAGLARCVEHLVDLGSCHILGEDATHAFAIQMDFEHDLGGAFTVFVEELLQHQHDKFHRCEVIVEHQHLVHLRRLGALGAALEHDRAAVVTVGQNGFFRGVGGGHGPILSGRQFPGFSWMTITDSVLPTDTLTCKGKAPGGTSLAVKVLLAGSYFNQLGNGLPSICAILTGASGA